MEEKKKLRRSKSKMICGVCGGIAEYFEWDVTIVRLATVALAAFTACVGVVPYLIAAIVIPGPEKTEE